jgi:hypothetical protein
MADQPFPIEQDYNRFVPPQVDEVLEEMTGDDDWDKESEENFVENEDGSITIIDPEPESIETGFGDNLAEDLRDSELATIAADYLEFIERDKEARKKRDEQYEEGIRRTGLGDDAPGGAGFSGASKVVHPVLAEGCVDFAARAIKELCPPNGPVRTQILGKTSGKKLQKATRKRNYLNWQLTKDCPEFFTELEQMLSQLPLGGSQYIKILPNERNKRPEFEFIPIDKMLVPFSASNFYTAQRTTHIQEITEQEFNRRINSGYYRDVSVINVTDPEESKAEKASNKVEGKDATTYNEDGLRTIYEITCYAELDFDELTGGKLAPYVICVDESLDTVLAIYRNWDEEDEDQQKLDWVVEFKFIPWRGAMGIGLPHLIGGLAAALTGALRALMDSAHVNNAPTALKLKGARLSGQTQQVDITQIQEIESAPGITDIRQLIMPMPFNAPSQVLFQLLDWLTNAAKGVVATAEEKIADASNQMPVGTALALIEQGSINYSAIHMRLHHAMEKLLEIVCRVNYDLLDEEVVVEALGEEVVYRQDFKGATDVIPVSDPNIFSESQRYAQIQAVMQLMEVGQAQGVKYNVQEVHRRALELMKVNDIDDVLPAQHKPVEMNAIAENVTLMLGNDIIVFPHQDHFSHIEAHLRFATDPNFGASQLVAGKVIPKALEHISQHIAFMYAQACNEVAMSAIPMGPDSLDVKDMDSLLAAVSAKVSAGSQQIFQPIQQMLQQAQQMLAQATPQQPLDPAVQVQKDIGMAEIERQKTRDAGELQLKTKVQDEKVQMELSNQQQATQKHIDELTAKAEEFKINATEMLHKAASEQQKLELERERMMNDVALERAQLEQQKIEFMQQQLSAVQQQPMADEPEEDVIGQQMALLELEKKRIEVQKAKADLQVAAPYLHTEQDPNPMVEAIQHMMQQQQDMHQLLAQHFTKPKSINVIRDARGRAISMTQE